MFNVNYSNAICSGGYFALKSIGLLMVMCVYSISWDCNVLIAQQLGLNSLTVYNVIFVSLCLQ